jgi:hypothetical protein
MILNFMERYFYLICFATYALEQASHGETVFILSFLLAITRKPSKIIFYLLRNRQ